jgi:predicted nucleotidyltransferase component of viral defense system
VIPRAHITAWRTQVPWPSDAQVEQDLVISRALVEMYTRPVVAESLAFRGGTALHKLHFEPPGRYSEDIDLVQIEAGPIGPALNAVREALDPWLGEPGWRRTADSVKLLYRFDTTALPAQRVRVKVEINTREHFTCRGLCAVDYSIATLWLTAAAAITTYHVEELLGTKLRALYQRKKGRDLYDLWAALAALDVDADGIVDCFLPYMASDGAAVTRAMFEAKLSEKVASPAFRAGGSLDPRDGGVAMSDMDASMNPILVSLDDVLSEVESQTDESTAYLNRRTGEFITISEEEVRLVEDQEGLTEDERGGEEWERLPDWRAEMLPKVREVLDSDDFLPLPSRFDIHEWAIMERFSLEVEDEAVREALLDAIHGSGAFRRFKAAVHRYGIAEAWYRYRDGALETIAVEWLEAHGIPYRRGRAAPSDEQAGEVTPPAL